MKMSDRKKIFIFLLANKNIKLTYIAKANSFYFLNTIEYP